MFSFVDLANINWIAIQVETTLALALCLAGIILCSICICEPCPAVSPKRWAVIAAGLMFASGRYIFKAIRCTSGKINLSCKHLSPISKEIVPKGNNLFPMGNSFLY